MQLFATGIKTAVKWSAVSHFSGTDQCSDTSSLGRKVQLVVQTADVLFSYLDVWYHRLRLQFKACLGS